MNLQHTLPCINSRRSARAAALLLTIFAGAAIAADTIAPNANLNAEGIPPIPAALAAKVAPYTEFLPTSGVAWHPEKRELLVARRAGNTTQLHVVSAAGGELRQVTSFTEPVRWGAYLARKPQALVFARDSGGNDPRVRYTEAEQIVAAARASGVPVWYLIADNEGHGFARKANADFQFYATIAFVEARVLNR